MARRQTSSSTNNTAPRERRRSLLSLIFMPVGVLFGLGSFIFFGVFFSVVIEWLGMLFGYFDYNHAATVLRTEFAYLGDNFTTTVFGISAEEAALKVINFFREWLVPAQSKVAGNPQQMVLDRYLDSFLANWVHYRNAFFFILMVTGIRCVIIFLSSALFVLVGIVAAIDGLHLRELRKVSGGIEHAGVYHHAKAMVPYAVWLSPVLYLAWPSAINPNVILLPGMVAFYLVVLVSFSTFKKFL